MHMEVPREPLNKTYLGDSVYAQRGDGGFWLTTENGYPDDPRNKIFLEIEVYISLMKWVDRQKAPKEG